MSLALVGVWLLSVGVADLGVLGADPPGRRRRLGCLAAGVLTAAVALLAVDVGGAARVLLLLAGAGLLAGWELGRHPVVRAGSLVAGGAGAVLAAGLVQRERGWAGWLQETVLAQWSTAGVLVTAGVLLAQVSTANLAVRLLLDAVGVPATTNEKQLRGGRVLGPMERVLLVALGALGELTAAAVVIAAKGLLRFPELQRAQRRGVEPDGPSDVTEYFLIGSLASWLLALGGAGVVHLAR